jgi:hypothetical protein
MFRHSNRFVLVFRNRSEVVHREDVDLGTLVHDVAFSAVCHGRLPNDGRWAPVEAEPAWAGESLMGVTVRVGGCARTYDRAVFGQRAIEILGSRRSVSEADGGEASELSWDLELSASDGGEGARGRGPRGRTSLRHQPYPLVPRDLVRRDEDGSGLQEDDGTGDALSIEVSSDLLAELRRESADSLDRERADFLVGRLTQAPNGRVAAELLDRIPAVAETEGTLVRFPFSPRTFHEARQELERRGSSLVILGHHHNHPPPCGRSCLMTIPACCTENVMFSLDDRVVHRAAFGRPYMVALVSGKGAERRADDPLMRAYGWRRGIICEKPWSIF